MAKTEIFDAKSLSWKDSEREYGPKLTVSSTFRSNFEDVPAPLHLHVDLENGLLVGDVAKYETWLREKGLL